jgi:hypothetical protein
MIRREIGSIPFRLKATRPAPRRNDSFAAAEVVKIGQASMARAPAPPVLQSPAKLPSRSSYFRNCLERVDAIWAALRAAAAAAVVRSAARLVDSPIRWASLQDRMPGSSNGRMDSDRS